MSTQEIMREICLVKGKLLQCSCPIEQSRLITALIALYDSYVFLTIKAEKGAA